MDKRFLIIMVVIVLAFVGIFVVSSNKSDQSTASGTPSNHIKGENSKGVELLAFGDFQCPHCADFFPIEQQVVNKYIKEISFQFRHFPLNFPHSYSTSRAAEAAGMQGKFFEMHDLLYINQKQWTNLSTPQSVFEQYAQQLNLDMQKYKTDFEAVGTNSTINADRKVGTDKGVTGTPTYFLNGKKLELSDIDSVEKFSKKIDEAIAASNQ